MGVEEFRILWPLRLRYVIWLGKNKPDFCVVDSLITKLYTYVNFLIKFPLPCLTTEGSSNIAPLKTWFSCWKQIINGLKASSMFMDLIFHGQGEIWPWIGIDTAIRPINYINLRHDDIFIVQNLLIEATGHTFFCLNWNHVKSTYLIGFIHFFGLRLKTSPILRWINESQRSPHGPRFAASNPYGNSRATRWRWRNWEAPWDLREGERRSIFMWYWKSVDNMCIACRSELLTLLNK